MSKYNVKLKKMIKMMRETKNKIKDDRKVD